MIESNNCTRVMMLHRHREVYRAIDGVMGLKRGRVCHVADNKREPEIAGFFIAPTSLHNECRLSSPGNCG
jgi:hypothetical protein